MSKKRKMKPEIKILRASFYKILGNFAGSDKRLPPEMDEILSYVEELEDLLYEINNTSGPTALSEPFKSQFIAIIEALEGK